MNPFEGDEPFDYDDLLRECVLAADIESTLEINDSVFKKYVEDCREQASSALNALAIVPPEDAAAIGELQSIVGRFRHACEWTFSALARGQEAADVLAENNDEIDVNPTFHEEDLENEASYEPEID